MFHIIVENVKYYFAGRIFSEILSLRWKWRQKWCSLQIQVWKFPLNPSSTIVIPRSRFGVVTQQSSLLPDYTETVARETTSTIDYEK